MRLRRLALVTLVAAAVVALPATSGFSAASADRSVEVAIVDDEDAYLGVSNTTSNTNMSTGTTDLDVTVTNRFGSDVTLETVKVTVDGETKDLGPLDSGSEGTASFSDVDCNSEIDVSASGDSVSIELEREVGC